MDGRSLALIQRLAQHRLIALFTPSRPRDVLPLHEVLVRHDVVLEITLRSSASLGALRALLERDPQALVLAGTVLTPAQATAAIEAGAAGIVSPDFFPEICAVCVQHDRLYMPGGLGNVATQLADKAQRYGCDPSELVARHPHQWVHKLFPAKGGVGDPVEVAQAWRGLFPNLRVCYTGGLGFEEAGAILQRDPLGIVGSSALARDALRDDGPARLRRWQELTRPPAERAASPRPPQATTRGVVVGLGEVMLRLSPPRGRRLVQTDRLRLHVGGAEANVVAALARWGHPARLVTALPAHDLGEIAVESLRGHGVDVTFIRRGGDRMGLYFHEPGLDCRQPLTIYDRRGSSIATLAEEEIDWDAALRDAVWFHWSGITPALGRKPAAILRRGIAAARERGLTVSVDLNYRPALWSPQEAAGTLGELVTGADVCLTNLGHAATLFGSGDAAPADSVERMAARARATARGLSERFGCGKVAVTLRRVRSASRHDWSGLLWSGGECHAGRLYAMQVRDRVGGGDAFAAGLVHGWLTGMSDPAALDFAVAAACLKHSVEGDICLATIAEVEALLGDKGAPRLELDV